VLVSCFIIAISRRIFDLLDFGTYAPSGRQQQIAASRLRAATRDMIFMQM